MTGPFHLAQINVARLKAPLDAPELKDFVDSLDRINALADDAQGFVWRLQGEGDNATTAAIDDPMVIVNMSVWTDLASLGAFVYRSDHIAVMRRRREFFLPPTETFLALWWIAAGHTPTVQEGLERLERLRRDGPGPMAFSFREPFAPSATTDRVAPILDECA